MTEDLKNLLSITKLFQHAKLYLALAGKSGSFVMGANFFIVQYRFRINDQTWTILGLFPILTCRHLAASENFQEFQSWIQTLGDSLWKYLPSYADHIQSGKLTSSVSSPPDDIETPSNDEHDNENYFTFDQSIECSQPALALVDLLDRDILKIARAKVTIFFCEFWYQIC